MASKITSACYQATYISIRCLPDAALVSGCIDINTELQWASLLFTLLQPVGDRWKRAEPLEQSYTLCSGLEHRRLLLPFAVKEVLAVLKVDGRGLSQAGKKSHLGPGTANLSCRDRSHVTVT